MAAANESQGLKIAVVSFICLWVITTVSCYFLYQAYAAADAKLTSTNDELGKANAKFQTAFNQFDEMRLKIGTKAGEFDAAKDEIAGHHKKIDERLTALQAAVDAAVAKAQAAGASSADLQDARDKIRQTIASYRGEPNKTYASSLDRAIELFENLTMLSTEMSVNYASLRQSLESATTVAKQQVDVEAKAAANSRADLDSEHKKHEEQRSTLLTTTDQLQTDNDKKATEIANLSKKLKDTEDDFLRKQETYTTIIRELRDKVERKETILDHPDGYVTYVDYERGEVLVDVTRRQGARPQMVMTIFDSQSPGIPTDKPKGTIMLTRVGEQFSTAKIIETKSPIDPIRVRDIVYSPAWSPNMPMRFALIGKIDVNRDSRDDREELKRMIQEAGGVVDYDLPPLDVGRESGTLSPRIDWYVIDEREPLRAAFEKESDQSLSRASKLAKRMGEMIKEARLVGIRPMPIERLLAYLGYDMNTPVVGRAEAVSTDALRRLTSPKRPAGAAAKTAAPADATAKPDEPKGDQAAPADKGGDKPAPADKGDQAAPADKGDKPAAEDPPK